MPDLPDNAYQILFVPLTRGKFAVVDLADAPMTAPYAWFYRPPRRIGGTGYAATKEERGADRGSKAMHRMLLGVTDPAIEVDHIDRDGLNNSRSNLRSCTRTQNLWNQPARRNSKTGFKGVVCLPNPDRRPNPYSVAIRVNGRMTRFGCFPDVESAARRADEVYRKFRGEHARLNFPAPGEQAARRDYVAQIV